MLVILCFWSLAAVKIDILFVFLTGEHWCFMKLRDTQDYMTCNGYPWVWTEGLWPHKLIFQLTGSFQHKFIVRNKEQNMITVLRKETSIIRKNLTDTRREGIASGNSTVFCKHGHKLGRLDHNYTYWESALRCVGEQINDCHHASVALKVLKAEVEFCCFVYYWRKWEWAMTTDGGQICPAWISGF